MSWVLLPGHILKYISFYCYHFKMLFVRYLSLLPYVYVLRLCAGS